MKLYRFAALALVVAAPAVAEPAATGAADGDSKIVCTKENLTGSRLGGRKRCMTVAEWAEVKRLDRQLVERIQMNRYNGNESLSGPIQGDFRRNN